METRPYHPSKTQRQWFIGTSRIKDAGTPTEQSSLIPEYVSRLHVSFTDLLLFSLIVIFWGLVFLACLMAVGR